MSFAALKETYENEPSALDDAMRVGVQDLQFLCESGVRLDFGDSTIVVRAAVTGVKGDWPFLISAGHFERSFRRQPKRGESQMQSPGICHLCLAGKGEFHYTDMSDEPCWASTEGSAAALCPF